MSHPIDRGTVRLVRSGVFSSNYTAGIVQIYYGSSSSSNDWGNICYDDSSFGSTEASVICNQLGYNGASGYGRAGSTTRYVLASCIYAMWLGAKTKHLSSNINYVAMELIHLTLLLLMLSVPVVTT